MSFHSVAISELRTRTSGFFDSFIMTVVGLSFATALPGPKNQRGHLSSSFVDLRHDFFVHFLLGYSFRSFGISREIPSNHISLFSVSFIFCFLLYLMGMGLCGANDLLYFNNRTHFSISLRSVCEVRSAWYRIFVSFCLLLYHCQTKTVEQVPFDD